MFKTRYRIVPDNWLGYEVQHKYWFWPFWIQTGFSNTHTSVEKAMEYINGQKQAVVVEL